MWERGQERFDIFTLAWFSDLISSDSQHVFFLTPALPVTITYSLLTWVTPSLKRKLTLGANSIKPHTMTGPKLYTYTSHNRIEEGKRTQILALDSYKFNATSGCKKRPFLFLCHLSVTLWTAAHISSFVGHASKKQLHIHNADLQLQHLPSTFSCRTKFHIQGQIMPAPVRSSRESRKKSQWGSLVQMRHDL